MICLREPRGKALPLFFIRFDRVQLDASKPDSEMGHDPDVIKQTRGNIGLDDIGIFSAAREEKVTARRELQTKVRDGHGVTKQIAGLVDDREVHRKAEAGVTDEHDRGEVRYRSDRRGALWNLDHEIRVPCATGQDECDDGKQMNGASCWKPMRHAQCSVEASAQLRA